MANQNRLELLAEVAQQYYQEGKSQAEIGSQLGISHSTVSRMIREAHEKDIVEVIVRFPLKKIPHLANIIKKEFGLKEAIVISSSGKKHRGLAESLGQLAAPVVEAHLKDGMWFGLGSGRSVAATVRHIRVREPQDVRVVRLQGMGADEFNTGTDLGQILAFQLGSTSIVIPAPWVMGSARACDMVMKEQSVSEALEMAENVDLALVGLGGMDSGATILPEHYLITPNEVEELKSACAVGEICGKFINSNGEVVAAAFNQRTVSIEVTKLSQINTVIGVAGGRAKASVILAAIRGGLINVLVTDSDAVESMLEMVGTNTQIPS